MDNRREAKVHELDHLDYDDILKSRVAFGTASALIDRLGELRDDLGLTGIVGELNPGGLLGVAIPTEYGGLGGGAADLTSVMEAIGEALIVEPFLATAMSARLVARAGTIEQKRDLLSAVADGTLTMAFAHSEQGARYDLAHVTTRARETAEGFAIDGDKIRHRSCRHRVRLARAPGVAA